MGWRVRHGLAGDIPFFVGLIALVGAAVGAVFGFLADMALHRHRSNR